MSELAECPPPAKVYQMLDIMLNFWLISATELYVGVKKSVMLMQFSTYVSVKSSVI